MHGRSRSHELSTRGDTHLRKVPDVSRRLLPDPPRGCPRVRLVRRPTHFARLVRLNYLAPDIVSAIFDGSQPEGLTRKDVLMSNVPTDWAVQRRLYGSHRRSARSSRTPSSGAGCGLPRAK